jgi:hypothetical protein
MSMRRLEEHAVASPPSGAVALSVARHITETVSHPDVALLHERRAKLIHNLVDELSLDVKDWGGTDAPHPSEIVDLIVAFGPAVIGAAATIIAAWITRPAKVPSASEGVLGVKLKRADGPELTATYYNTPQEEVAGLIESFMQGGGRAVSGRREMSKGLERLQGRIVSLGTNSWLVRQANGDTHRVTTGTALEAAGHFVLGDEVAIHVTADRQAVLAEHTGEDRRASFKRSIGDMRKRTGASGLHLQVISRLPDQEYDGMPITCEENAQHELVRATAIDHSGLERQLTIEKSWALFSDPTAVLRYSENGAEVYFAQISISPDFRFRVAFSDSTRTFWYEAAINHGSGQKAFIELNGSVLQRYGAKTDAWVSGTYKNGLLNVDLDPYQYFPDAMTRAAYFGPLLAETSPPADDPLNDPKNQQVLQNSATVSAREWGLIAVTTLGQFIVRLGCSAWEVWPWGTALCGVTTLSTVVSGVLANSTYLAPASPPPITPPAPFTPPPTTVTPPLGNDVPPLPFPSGCTGGCAPNQICLGGQCVDLTGPTGNWGPNDF